MSETAITLYDRIENPLEAVEKLGKVFAKSGMFGCEKEEQGQLLALACMATKKDPFQFLDENHLINGRRSMRADRMLANYRARGGKVKWKQFDDKAAVGLWTFDGDTTEVGFTFAEAERAGLVRPKSAWQTFPAEMLRARAISRAVRMLCPEAIAGAYLPDERPSEGETVSAPTAEQPRTELFSKPEAGQKNTGGEAVSSAARTEGADKGAPQTSSTDRGGQKETQPVIDVQSEVVTEPPKPVGDYMEFMKVIKGHEEAVFNWLVKTGKIKPEQKISDAPAGLMRKACEKPDKFLAAVGVTK